MKQLLTLLLVTITAIGFSQNKFHFGVQANGNFTTGIPSISNWPAEYYKGIETFSFCYSAGGTVEYDLTDKWNLQSGLLFRKSGDRSKYAFDGIDVNSGFIYQTGNIPRGGPHAFKFRYYGIEMPLNIYYALTDKFKIGTGGSVVYNFKAKAQEYYSSFLNPTPYEIAIYNNFHFLMNLGLQYKLNNKLQIEAYSQYFLTEIFAADFNTLDVPRNYLSLGLNVGYKFN